MVHIGRIIWKEMKSKEIPRAQFLELLKEQDIQIKELFQKETIPITALIKISAILKKNLFEYYNHEDLSKLADPDFYSPFKNKVEKLHELVNKKSSLLKAQKIYIHRLESLISTLEQDQSEPA
jgi:hypothetical protein